MTYKIKTIFIITLILLVLFFSLNAAEPSSAASLEEKKIEGIAERVFPSVVKVESRNRTRKVATGVVIDKDGCIVTTALISPRDEEIFITTSEGKRYEAEFLGMDSVTHLALLQVKKSGLPPIKTGTTKDLSPGSWIGVVSISPENTPSITQGIVSSISQDKLRLNIWVIPGSSGSPVVDSEGKMVGLLRGIYAEDMPVFFEFREREHVGTGYVFSRAEAPSSGMALAVPVAIVEEISSQIKKKGKVERGWLGVSIVEDEEGRVVITRVERESPAELARLEKGDIILKFDGKEVTGSSMLAYEIKSRKPGENVVLTIERNGKKKEIEVKLGELPEAEIKRELELRFPRLFPHLPPRPPEEPGSRYYRFFEKRKFIGVYLQELTEELSEHFGIEKGRGLLVSKVSKGSPAEKAGIKVGDVIVKADGKRVERVEELVEIIQDKNRGEKIKIEFLRERKMMSVDAGVEEEEEGDWRHYWPFWEESARTLKRDYEIFKERYGDEYKKTMERLNRELKKLKEEASEKSAEALKKWKEYFFKAEAIRI